MEHYHCLVVLQSTAVGLNGLPPFIKSNLAEVGIPCISLRDTHAQEHRSSNLLNSTLGCHTLVVWCVKDGQLSVAGLKCVTYHLQNGLLPSDYPPTPIHFRSVGMVVVCVSRTRSLQPFHSDNRIQL